jgi:hypothetical protein
MPLSEGLWDSLVPPEVWVTISSIDREEHDHVKLTVRVKEIGERSVSATLDVTRYAPTASILLAASKCVEALALAQTRTTGALLKAQLRAAIGAWVDPF